VVIHYWHRFMCHWSFSSSLLLEPFGSLCQTEWRSDYGKVAHLFRVVLWTYVAPVWKEPFHWATGRVLCVLFGWPKDMTSSAKWEESTHTLMKCLKTPCDCHSLCFSLSCCLFLCMPYLSLSLKSDDFKKRRI